MANILIVEDEKNMQSIITEYMQRFNDIEKQSNGLNDTGCNDAPP